MALQQSNSAVAKSIFLILLDVVTELPQDRQHFSNNTAKGGSRLLAISSIAVISALHDHFLYEHLAIGDKSKEQDGIGHIGDPYFSAGIKNAGFQQFTF